MRTDVGIVRVAGIQHPAEGFFQSCTVTAGINLRTNEQHTFIALDRIDNKVPVGCQFLFEVVGPKVMLYGISINTLVKTFVFFNQCRSFLLKQPEVARQGRKIEW